MDKAASNKVEEQTLLKLTLVGDEQVGKTCLATRIIQDRCEQSEWPTLGAGRLERVYPEHKLKLEIHDTSGQEKYRAIVPLYTKFADWIIYAFDLTRPETLDRLETYWLAYLQRNAPGSTMIALCGCKSDLEHQIDPQLLRKYQRQYPYFETSALEGANTKGIVPRMLEQWEKKRGLLELRGEIAQLQGEREKLSVRMGQIDRLIGAASRKQLSCLQQMISHSKENDPSLQNIKKEYKKKLKEFQKSNEESPPKWAFGTLDKLSNSPETLVELYEADTLKMREGFGAGGKIGEIAGGLKERCRILQGICDEIEGVTIMNLTQVISRVGEAYKRYKQEYCTEDSESFVINEDQVSFGLSKILDPLNFSQIFEQ